MKSIEAIISESRDVREVKRALSVKLLQSGLSAIGVSEVLNVSVQYVSKWKVKYEAEGAEALGIGYQGRESYLTEHERSTAVEWIQQQETVSVEQVRDYVEAEYGVVYASKQSYYELLAAGGMSYHKSEKENPKRDEAQVQARREEIKKNWHPIARPSSGAK